MATRNRIDTKTIRTRMTLELKMDQYRQTDYSCLTMIADRMATHDQIKITETTRIGEGLGLWLLACFA